MYVRIKISQNCSHDFLHKKSCFLQVHIKVNNCFLGKEFKIGTNQYFLFHLMGIQQWNLTYELTFPRVLFRIGCELSEHSIDQWIGNLNEENKHLFLHLAFLKFMNFPSFFVLNFVKEFMNQLGVSKTLALMSSFPHKLAHYHADFQCFVTVMNSVLLQGGLTQKNGRREEGVLKYFFFFFLTDIKYYQFIDAASPVVSL